MNKTYELTVIFAPVLKEEGLKSAIGAIENLTKKLSGKVVEMVEEGKESLAYPIKKYPEGIYVFFRLELPPANVVKFEAELKIQKGVIRQLLVKQE